MVYDDISIEMPAIERGSRYAESIRSSVQVLGLGPRLVSRQFKQEAEAQPAKRVVLSLEDHDMFYYNIPTFARQVLQTTTDLNVSLISYCAEAEQGRDCDGTTCEAAYGIANHCDWLGVILPKFCNLTTTDVTVDIGWSSDDRGTWTSSSHGKQLLVELEELEKISSLTSVRVYKYTNLSAMPSQIPDTRGDLWVSWKRTKGWQAPQAEKSTGDA